MKECSMSTAKEPETMKEKLVGRLAQAIVAGVGRPQARLAVR